MKKPETPQPETPKPETPKKEDYESGGDFNTPEVTSPSILLPTAHRDDQPSNKAKTPLVTTDVIAKLCKTVVSQNNKDSDADDEDPYATYEANDLDDETNDEDETHDEDEDLF